MLNKIRPRLKPGETERTTAKQAAGGVLGLLGFDPGMFAVFETWDKETRGLLKGCEAVAIQGTRICVRVRSTVHRQELLYSKERILRRINQAMGRQAITDITFELETEAPGTKPKGGTFGEQSKDRWSGRFR